MNNESKLGYTYSTNPEEHWEAWFEDEFKVLWIETPNPRNPDWNVLYRLILTEGGPIITELRFVPEIKLQRRPVSGLAPWLRNADVRVPTDWARQKAAYLWSAKGWEFEERVRTPVEPAHGS